MAKTVKKKKSAREKRTSVRFKPDEQTIASLDLENLAKSQPFRPTIAGLVTQESYRGCALVVVMSRDMQIGDRLRVRIGPGPVLAAEVRWRTELDPQVMRIGVMYLE